MSILQGWCPNVWKRYTMVLENRTERKINTGKEKSEEKVLELKSGENKWRNKNRKWFKGKWNKCGRCGHRVSDWWVNNNKNYNINDNKTTRKPCFNEECSKCGKIRQKDAGFGAKKGKEKDDDLENLFVGATLCGEVQEDNN